MTTGTRLAHATNFAMLLAFQSHVLYVLSMPATHGNLDLDREIIERRKRAFKAALLIGGNSQGAWARRHELNETEVSNVLAGRRQNPIVLGLIYKEIERVRRTASAYMAEAL